MALSLLGRRLSRVRFIWCAHMSSKDPGKTAEMGDALKNNPFYKKYSDKIAALPHAKLAEVAEQKKDKSPISVAKKEAVKPNPSPKPKGKTPYVPKKLDDIVKMDLLVEKTSEEIGEIWQNYHRYKDGLAAVMPGYVYKTLRARGQTYPTFLLPLPRSEGYEFVVTQFHNNEVHFALLAEYQLHKENAPECMSLTYYAELLDTKDIVLMRGEFDSVRLSVLEAQCLANTLQLYYCGPEHPERTRLLKTFNANPAKFDHMELIAAMENVGFGEMPGPMGKHPKPPASPQPKS